MRSHAASDWRTLVLIALFGTAGIMGALGATVARSGSAGDSMLMGRASSMLSAGDALAASPPGHTPRDAVRRDTADFPCAREALRGTTRLGAGDLQELLQPAAFTRQLPVSDLWLAEARANEWVAP